MPSHKRPYDSRRSDYDDSHDDSQPPPPSGDDGGDGDADESESSSYEDDGSEEEPKGEYVPIPLPDIRKDVQCPICLGIIRKTRTVMECLHRFCRACIDKSMRLGNNECPACRTHCASCRSLRDDPNYDALIAAMFPDIDRYEEEELAFHKEEKARNKQIQALIAETVHRQTEALGRKRTTAKTPVPRRSQSLQRNGQSRGKRSHLTADIQGSDDSDDANSEGGKSSSSSAEEQSAEVRIKRYKRARGLNENGIEVNIGSSSGLVAPSERLAWGKGGIRSNTQYGSAKGANGKSSRKTRIHKLIDHLRKSGENNNELDIQLMLVPLDKKTTPSLQQPYLCCRPTLSVKQLRQYVALQTTLQADEVEIYLVKELNFKVNFPTSEGTSNSVASMMDSSKEALQILEENDTLAGLQTHNFMQGNLLLVYKQEISDPKSQPNSQA